MLNGNLQTLTLTLYTYYPLVYLSNAYIKRNMNMFKDNLIKYFKLAGDYVIDIPKEECDDKG